MSTQSIFSLKMSDINQSRMAESIVFMWKKLHLELRHFLNATSSRPSVAFYLQKLLIDRTGRDQALISSCMHVQN